MEELMVTQRTTRSRRPKEERIRVIDEKIARHKKLIEDLEEKKNKIVSPNKPRRKVGMATVLREAKKKGISPEVLLKKLESIKM